MAIDTARRNVGLLNQEYFDGIDERLAEFLAGRGFLDFVEVEPEMVRVYIGAEVVQRKVVLLLVVLYQL